jgi:rhodanese-related sulfurtransferase
MTAVKRPAAMELLLGLLPTAVFVLQTGRGQGFKFLPRGFFSGNYVSLMQHAPGFLKLVNEVRPHVKEITIDEARARLAANPNLLLVDVREDDEWKAGHAAEAMHLGKGILERDIEAKIPDVNAEIIMYCGGGYRSALTADVAKKMGYKNVSSLIGGYKGMVAANWPMIKS